MGTALFRSLNATNTCVSDPYEADGTISGERSLQAWHENLMVPVRCILAEAALVQAKHSPSQVKAAALNGGWAFLLG